MDAADRKKIIEKFQELEKQVVDLLPIIKDHVSEGDESYLKELIEHNESGIAYKAIIETIALYAIKLTNKNFDDIKKAGISMEFNEEIWMNLKKFL